MDAAERLTAFRSDGAFYRGDSFPTIAGAGANGAIVHYRANVASNRRLEAGSLFLLDSGGQYLDGTTDVTRTVALGEPTSEMRTRFTLVLKGHIAVATARFPRGTLGSQLDALARLALWAEGLDYDHGTGHGVGHYLCVHEGPQGISKLPSRAPLEPGMVVSNEPGYYKPKHYGIRIENLVAVVALPDRGEGAVADAGFLGFETLTLAPIDRGLVDPALLDDDEVGWLDRYHADVYEALAAEVDSVTRDWLEQATRPLRS
jgi:Xaa-Pro aminopeptidase